MITHSNHLHTILDTPLQSGTSLQPGRKCWQGLLLPAPNCLLDFPIDGKGQSLSQYFPQGCRLSQACTELVEVNIAFRLLEAWRNLRLSTADFCSLYSGRYQIRFDTS